ncbi:FG-GAP-like repeat-containing protein [Aquihabitans sp. McL0605]|uniref:FG-GAP-like repeat-containing protein n=1 Tax=Aquihabitans sp. McL0605 TaxID=3415671 RepID=UPI003CFBB6CB
MTVQAIGRTRRRHRAATMALAVLATLVPLVAAAPQPAGATAPALGFQLADLGMMIVDPGSGRVFVSGADKVVAFSPEGAQLGAITPVPEARGMAFDDDGFLWVAESGADALAKIDPSTLTKVAEYPVGAYISASIATIAGQIWFFSPRDFNPELRSLDPTTSEVTDHGIVQDSWNITEIPGSTTQALMAASSGKPYRVHKVDLTTNPITVIGEVEAPAWSQLNDLAVTEAGTFLVAASNQSSRLVEYSSTPDAAGVMHPTGASYPTSQYGTTVAYSPGAGGLIATESEQGRLTLSRRGVPLVAEGLTDGFWKVALAPDATRAYLLTGDDDRWLSLTTRDLAPTVTGISGPAIPRGVDARRTITGTGLGLITSVKLGGAPVALSHQGPNQITIDVRTSATVGTQPLVLDGPLGPVSTTVQVIANGTATLRGTVTRAGTPVAGASVSLTGETGPARTTTTGPEGTYQLANVAFGRHLDLVITAPGTSTSIASNDLVLDGTVDPSAWTRDVDFASPPHRTLERRRLPLPPGDVRQVITDPATGRAYVAVGDAIVVVDSNGRQVGRIPDQWEVSDLQIVGSKLYAMLPNAGKLSEIDTSSLAVVRSLALRRASSGSFAITGNRVRFADGSGPGRKEATLDLTTGAVTGGLDPTLDQARFGSIEGAPNRYLAWSPMVSAMTVAHLDGTAATPAVLATDKPWSRERYPFDFVASATADRLWGDDGSELVLSTMTPTGTNYPGTSSSAVAHSPGHGGVLAFQHVVARAGDARATHTLTADPARYGLALDAAGDRAFIATAAGELVVDGLAPVVDTATPAPVIDQPAPITLTGAGLGGATSVRFDGVSVPFTITDAEHLKATPPTQTPGAHLVTVTSPWGASVPITASFAAPLKVTAAAPASGTALGGTTVTLTGSNLLGTTGVTFGGRPATDLHVVSATTLTVTAPPHPAGGAVIVAQRGTYASTGGPRFRYLDPPTPVSSLPAVTRPQTLGGAYQPIAGDFDGDGTDDLLLYQPGAGADVIRTYRGDGTFTTRSVSVSGTFTPVAGDFTGDGVTDVLWYAPGSAPDSLWDFNTGGTHTSTPITINGTYRPVAGDFTGDHVDDILWYAPGTAPDSLWDFNTGGTHTTTPITINGTYRPVAGDFTGDHVDDILWYAPGTAPDSLWDFNIGGTRTTTAVTAPQAHTYTPVAGDFTGDDVDDILWYASGGPNDPLWEVDAGGSHTTTTLATPPSARPTAADLTGGGTDDIFWYGPGTVPDVTWFMAPLVP